MEATLSEFLRASKENGHSLNTLIALTEKFSYLNVKVSFVPIPEIGWNELSDIPGVEATDIYLEASKAYAKMRNAQQNPGELKDDEKIPGYIPGKKL